MQDMLQRIAEAEQQADQILEQANEQAKEMITRAKTESEEMIVREHADALKQTEEAIGRAEAEGETAAAEILEATRKGILAIRQNAAARIPEAVSYLMERIETTV